MAVELPDILLDLPPHLLTLEFLTADQIKALIQLTVDCETALNYFTDIRVGLFPCPADILTEVLEQLEVKWEVLEYPGESNHRLFDNCQVVFAHAPKHLVLEKAARFSTVPVVNFGSDCAQPVEVLASLLKLKKSENFAKTIYLSASTPRLSWLRLCYLLGKPVRIEAEISEYEKVLIDSLRGRGAKIEVVSGEAKVQKRPPLVSECKIELKSMIKALLTVYGLEKRI